MGAVMQREHLDFAYSVIADLALENHIPVGRDSTEQCDDFGKKVSLACDRIAAHMQAQLAIQKVHSEIERRDILLESLEVEEVMESVIERGYARCRLADIQEHNFAMLQIDQERINKQCRVKQAHLAAAGLKVKLGAVTQKLKRQFAERQGRQQ